MAIAVSDSSVLIHLGLIGELELVQAAFEQIIVPPQVWREVVVQGQSADVVKRIEQAATDGWVKQVEPGNAALLQTLRQNLHEGESAAICLAVELKPDFLLMDESVGRSVAASLGIRTKGVIGLVLDAKRSGRLAAVKPVVDLLVQSRFHLSAEFVAQILREANEG